MSAQEGMGLRTNSLTVMDSEKFFSFPPSKECVLERGTNTVPLSR
jgi:hypothetical protein